MALVSSSFILIIPRVVMVIDLKDETPISCHHHGVVTTWGKLSLMQKACVEEELDYAGDEKELCFIYEGRMQ